MERFERHELATREQVEVQLLDLVPSENEWDDYREVRLLYPDGRCYRGTFWPDPMERGGHWWEERGMVIVQEISTEQILAAVDDVLRKGAVNEAFEQVC